MRRLLVRLASAFVAALCLLPSIGQAPASAGPSIPNAALTLQGLDKITARVRPIEVRIDEETRFGALVIRPRACFTTPATEAPESAAFLEIWSVARDEARELVFSGWMFASSPGVSALDHAVYDVWVLACREPSDELLPPVPPEPASPPPSTLDELLAPIAADP